MTPTPRAVVVFALGLPAALLPTLVDARLWTLWLAFVGMAVLAMVVDAECCKRSGQNFGKRSDHWSQDSRLG